MTIPSDKIHRRVKWTLIITAITSIIGTTAGTTVIMTRPDIYNPLGPYPNQVVGSRVEGIDGPAVAIHRNPIPGVTTSQELKVSGEKCSRDTTKVSGGQVWVEIEPRGSLIPGGHGVSTREKGCTTFQFSNALPAEVIDRVITQADQGITKTTWIIAGTETPIDNDGSGGSPQAWQTEEFTIVVT